MAIYRGPGGAGDATVDATNASSQAVDSAAAAAASASSASTSATAAASSATAASGFADDAEAAQLAAETAKDDAETAQAAAEAAQAAAEDAAAEAAAFVPDQTGNSGKFLTTDGTSTSWATVSGGGGGTGDGSVTSVAMTVPTGLSVTGSPITTTGTLAVTYASGYSIPTTTNQTNWSTAYGWGNHASAGYALTADLADVATSGSYNDLTDKPTLTTNLDGLTDVTITTPSSGQVLKYNGTAWINDTDSTGGGGGATYLPILSHSGSSVEIAIAGGYISVTNRSGSTISIPVY